MSSYTSRNIKVLNQKEIESKMIWIKAQSLADQYHSPLSFIQRSLEALELSGANLEWFISKYLEKDPEMPRNKDFEAISRELQIQAFRG